MSDHDERFAKLAALPAGWDSYGSAVISPAAIERAKAFLGGVQIVPTSDGGIQLEWHREGVEVEVNFRADGAVEGLFAMQPKDEP